jgi:hypothetical protein
LTGYSDSASAAAGTGTNAPFAQVTAGSVTYYNGTNGYATKAINSDGSFSGVTGDIALPPVTINDTTNNVTVTLSGAIHRGDTSVVHDPQACGTQCTRNQADANPTPVTIDVEYQVMYAGAAIADLDLHLAPGTLLAGASYQPAPT